jgi:mRNA-degrading endonuclease RelE of RelBE toxin-antitoxin system
VVFRIVLSEIALRVLDQISVEEARRIRDCLDQLARNPYRDIDQRVTLILPLRRVYRDAYRCGDWAIGYEFQDEDTLLIQMVGNLYY